MCMREGREAPDVPVVQQSLNMEFWSDCELKILYIVEINPLL